MPVLRVLEGAQRRCRQSLKWACRRRDELDRATWPSFAVIPAVPRPVQSAPSRSLAPDQALGHSSKPSESQRNGLLFALSLRLGLRPGEAAAGLHWDDITHQTTQRRHVGQRHPWQPSTVRGVDPRSWTTSRPQAAKRTIAAPPDIASVDRSEHRKAQSRRETCASHAPSGWVSDPQLVFASPNRGTVLSPPPTQPQAARQRFAPPPLQVVPDHALSQLRHSCASLLSRDGRRERRDRRPAGPHDDAHGGSDHIVHRLRPTVDVAVTADWVTG